MKDTPPTAREKTEASPNLFAAIKTLLATREYVWLGAAFTLFSITGWIVLT
ncbi:MAG: hypothetical protein U0Y68_18575 [Blastocatellia bacterium]